MHHDIFCFYCSRLITQSIVIQLSVLMFFHDYICQKHPLPFAFVKCTLITFVETPIIEFSFFSRENDLHHLKCTY